MNIPEKILSLTPISISAEREQPENKSEWIKKRFVSAAQDHKSFMTLSDENLIKAYKDLSKQEGLQLLPVIPNVPGFIREATEYGLAGAGIRRLLRVGAKGVFRLGTFGVLKTHKVLLKRDFPTILSILCEMEMNEFRKFKPPVVFLQQQMTDLMLALNNRRVFENFAKQIRKRYRSEPGLVTANFVQLTEKLIEWDIDISVIAAPVNRDNFLMPKQGEVQGLTTYEKALESGRFKIVATRLATIPEKENECLNWALEQPGVIAGVIESL